eukprot:TRINITY_DN44359_c0_g1_i1.p1 TRINITY_DN44359_c0_g1~~TRINITY_DN44359_c0_g1_i1.p1  ORF type:complete len:467 (+),score=81.14 TRINITY_DN44359_c0_g1_i1:125-1525(+)
MAFFIGLRDVLGLVAEAATRAMNQGRAQTPQQQQRTPGDEREVLQRSESLIRPVPEDVLGRLFFASVASGLVVAWCVFDDWNEVIRVALFRVAVASGTDVADGTGANPTREQHFRGAIPLTFLEFVFTGSAFGALWIFTAGDRPQQLSTLRKTIVSAPWPLLVASHAFCTFWLHSLSMPSQLMSFGAFAACRTLEVPFAAVIRSRGPGTTPNEHLVKIVVGASAGSFLLYYSYLHMDGCVCLRRGAGVSLEGLPLYVVFLLLIALAPVTAVCQETMLKQYRMNPLLMLSMQNLLAGAIFGPVLLLGEVLQSFRMILEHQEIALLVLWLCIQATVLSCISVLLVRCLNSFWTVTLRSLRVVYWWCWKLVTFYASTHSLLSLMRPKVSAWSFGMLLGVALTAAALASDFGRRFATARTGKGQGDFEEFEALHGIEFEDFDVVDRRPTPRGDSALSHIPSTTAPKGSWA